MMTPNRDQTTNPILALSLTLLVFAGFLVMVPDMWASPVDDSDDSDDTDPAPKPRGIRAKFTADAQVSARSAIQVTPALEVRLLADDSTSPAPSMITPQLKVERTVPTQTNTREVQL